MANDEIDEVVRSRISGGGVPGSVVWFCDLARANPVSDISRPRVGSSQKAAGQDISTIAVVDKAGLEPRLFSSAYGT